MLSPLMKQYLEIKQEHPDCILMCRIGDFYEMFYEDARTASRELDLVLTGKDCGMEERAPMCGVPYHAAEGYIAKLVSRGYRVAVCEQTEDPAAAKGLVRRDVIRIITPGTVTEGGYLEESRNNYIAAVCFAPGICGAAFADISTGEVFATELIGDDLPRRLLSEASAYSPSELVVPEPADDTASAFNSRFGTLVTAVPPEEFSAGCAAEAIKSVYGEDCDVSDLSMLAAGALLGYVARTQKRDLSYLKPINRYSCEEYLSIDFASRRNLELCETLRTGAKKGSLLWAVDRTRTGAGARLLRARIERPLMNERAIRFRLDGVKEMYEDGVAREEIREKLKDAADIARLLTRLVYGTANPRDLKTLERTIKLLPGIKELISGAKSPCIASIREKLDTLDDIGEAIFNTIDEEPAFTVREGGFIKPGCNSAVDELRRIMTDGRQWIAKIEEVEREKTGIKSLKIGYNRVFGYYLEVSRNFMDKIPDTYIRRQTLANGERFVTPELKDMEARVLGAKDRLGALEYELFCALRDHIIGEGDRLRGTAEALAELDVCCSNAAVAAEQGYVCPEIDGSDVIDLKNSRHPVVERFLEGGYFVPNDCRLDCASNRLMLITGPNMAGKSTYMRQVALCVILAQAGCFVPASSARIGVVDRVFTRVGASDDLASGNSTFMLEMNEVAGILKNATRKSLIIYDEIGRGTSTYDGMSIARAVVEFTAEKIGAKTLFATHYHELTELENELDGVFNRNIAAKKRGNDIVFLRKIVSGAADDSYGIEVARLAGVPENVVKRAKQILAGLDSGAPRRAPSRAEGSDEISFEDLGRDRVIEKLKNCDINTISPYEALTLLYELKKEI